MNERFPEVESATAEALVRTERSLARARQELERLREIVAEPDVESIDRVLKDL